MLKVFGDLWKKTIFGFMKEHGIVLPNENFSEQEFENFSRDEVGRFSNKESLGSDNNSEEEK